MTLTISFSSLFSRRTFPSRVVLCGPLQHARRACVHETILPTRRFYIVVVGGVRPSCRGDNVHGLGTVLSCVKRIITTTFVYIHESGTLRPVYTKMRISAFAAVCTPLLENERQREGERERKKKTKKKKKPFSSHNTAVRERGRRRVATVGLARRRGPSNRNVSGQRPRPHGSTCASRARAFTARPTCGGGWSGFPSKRRSGSSSADSPGRRRRRRTSQFHPVSRQRLRLRLWRERTRCVIQTSPPPPTTMGEQPTCRCDRLWRNYVRSIRRQRSEKPENPHLEALSFTLCPK